MSRYFSQNLFGQSRRIPSELPEWNKLNNISVSVLSQLSRVERRHIAVKLVHLIEVSAANSNNNDAQWQTGAFDNLINGFIEVGDDTIGDNQAYRVLLIVLAELLLLVFCESIDELQYACKVGRAI